MSKENIIITGSGMSAMILARMIKKYKDSTSQITIIEKESEIGGQYGSFNYDKYGYFDHGMHLYYESCIPEIDELFTSVLPLNQWHVLSDNEKDIAGLFVNGKLQQNTPYVDLRELSTIKRKQYIAELLVHIEQSDSEIEGEENTAYDIILNQFGKTITEEIFVPILEKLYGKHALELDEIATQLTTINRIALFDEKMMLKLMSVVDIKSRVCYPNQYTLPKLRNSTQRAFYPKKYGMSHVLHKLKSDLENEGVTFMTSSMVTEMSIENNKIQSISISSGNSEHKLKDIKQVYWTAGLPSLASCLNLNMSNLKYDKQVNKAFYINLLFDKNPEMGKLYYFYCFDKGYSTFRVTNYSNYCPDASNQRGYPVCVELWVRTDNHLSDGELIQLAITELKQFKVINDTHKMLFSKCEPVKGGGFPLPTVNNVGSMNSIREQIANVEVTNLTPIGVYANKSVFFLKDVLLDAYHKVLEN